MSVMTEIKSKRQERGDLIHNARAILDAADQEGRELTVEEDEQFNQMHNDSDLLRDQISALERQAQAARDERQQSSEKDAGSLYTPPGVNRIGATTAPSDLTAGGRYRIGQEHVDRAIAAWARKQCGMPLDDQDQYSVSLYQQHVDRRFSPESRDLVVNFSNSMRWRGLQAAFRSMHPSLHFSNALDTGTGGGEAGHTIPEGFVQNLERAMLAFGGMLQVSQVMTTDSGNDLPWPTANDTSNKGALLTEATSIGSSVDPSFAAVIFQAFKYSSQLVQVSAEIIQDSAFDLPSLLGSMLGERLGRILNEHFTTGTGSDQPNGIVTAATVVAAASPTAITSDELIDLQHSVDPAYRPMATWMMHDSTVAAVRKLKDADNQYLWQPGLQDGVPDRLLGRMVSINQDMPEIEASAKTILYGDLSKYKVRLAGQVRARRLVERYADTDQEGFVSFMRADGDLLDAGTNPVKVLQQAAS